MEICSGGRSRPAISHLIPETEEEEDELAQKPPREVSFNNGKNNIFYVANNTAATYPIPVHLQRYMLLDYSKKHGLTADLELFDLEDMLHLPTLWHIVEHRNVNVIMYSIFALPEEEPDRNRMLELALKKGMIFHFVNEGLALTSAEDLATIKHYLEFSKYGKSRLPIGLPLSDFSRAYFNKWSASLAEWRNSTDVGVKFAPSERKSKRTRLVGRGAEDVNALESLTTSENKSLLTRRSKDPAGQSDVLTDDVLELLCRNAPQQAFELALDTFARVAETTRAMVEEQAIDLALIEAQREEIDRKQAENRILLRELVGQIQ